MNSILDFLDFGFGPPASPERLAMAGRDIGLGI